MKPLMQLLVDNRGRGQFRCETGEGESTLYLYDAIVFDDYWGGVSAEVFIKALNAITDPLIHLRINSPGGDVFAARAIEQAIREHSSQVIAHIDGYAASAASYVALACDEVHIAEGGFYMIHKAWTVAFGNADDLLSVAELLEKVDASLVKTYARETGQEVDQINIWMAAETWFNAEEAVEFGFADKVAEPVAKSSASAQAAAECKWNLAAYANAPAVQTVKPAPEPDPDTQITDHLLRRLQVVEKPA